MSAPHGMKRRPRPRPPAVTTGKQPKRDKTRQTSVATTAETHVRFGQGFRGEAVRDWSDKKGRMKRRKIVHPGELFQHYEQPVDHDRDARKLGILPELEGRWPRWETKSTREVYGSEHKRRTLRGGAGRAIRAGYLGYSEQWARGMD